MNIIIGDGVENSDKFENASHILSLSNIICNNLNGIHNINNNRSKCILFENTWDELKIFDEYSTSTKSRS